MAKVTFLGTGGGRHTTMFQARSTGGFLLECNGCRVHVDPGPGALTNMCLIGYDLRQTDAVVVSHCHPDHYSDAQVVIEGMTRGGWVKRGEVFGSVTAIDGQGGLGPMLSPYHRNLPMRCSVIKAGDRLEIGDVDTEIMKADHNDPTNVGFKFHTENGIFSYVSDTYYSDEIADQYKGSRVLLLPITTPSGNRIKGHLCTDDAIPFLERVKPELCIFIHLGIVMLKNDPYGQAKMVEDATGVRTIVGEDLMTLDIGEELTLGKAEPHKPEWNDAWNL